MRVGEILLEHGWVDRASLQRALTEQHMTGKRLCSLLVGRGILEPDHASLALAEQHAVAAALQKHLEHRDRSLAPLLTAALAHRHVALPLGRLRNGDLIVCARDPSPELHGELQRATRERIVLAVAPAQQLERLVEQTYEALAAEEEFEVDMTTGPIATLDDPAVEFSLADLDDARVTKDFTQQPIQSGPVRSSPALAAAPAPAVKLDDTLAGLTVAGQRDAATEIAMRFVTGRWTSSLLLAVREGAALGHRGHGAALSSESVLAITIPLASPSLVKHAHSTRQLASDARPGAIQDRLVKLLGQPQRALAAPIVVGPRVACVLVVGDPLGHASAATGELERLATALGEAYARIVRDAKR